MQKLDSFRIEMLTLIFSIVLIGFLFQLILKRRIREEYFFVWLSTVGAVVFFIIFRAKLDTVAMFIGIYYAPSLLFLLIFGALLIYCLHLSVVASNHSEQIKTLAQKIALLEEELLQKKSDATPGL